MAEYCARQDILNRLTESGLKALVDRNADGTIGDDEYANFVDVAIQEAGTDIDLSLQHLIQPSKARDAGTVLLRRLAVDLTVERLATLGGADPSVSIHMAGEDARRMLRRISTRTLLVPGLKYPSPDAPTSGNVIPKGRVVNF